MWNKKMIENIKRWVEKYVYYISKIYLKKLARSVFFRTCIVVLFVMWCMWDKKVIKNYTYDVNKIIFVNFFFPKLYYPNVYINIWQEDKSCMEDGWFAGVDWMIKGRTSSKEGGRFEVSVVLKGERIKKSKTLDASFQF